MTGILKCLDDGKQYHLTQTFTKIGKENCDINVTSPLVESRHAVIEYDNNIECFVIEDLNTPHGTYVNDCRVQNAKVRISHGDVIRLGHGGPQFEILLDINSNPPVVMQQVWQEPSKNTNLPYLPRQPTATSGTIPKQYSALSYGRHSGYHGHNKTVPADSDVYPHPPVRQRPLSANPANGVFLNAATKSANFTKDFLVSLKTSDQVLDLESKLLKMGDELSRLAAFEAECYRKDGVIISLRNEVGALQNKDSAVSEENVRTLASLQNQISLKNNEMHRLHEENCKLKQTRYENSAVNTNQIAEMRTLLARHDQNISVMENEMKKANQEKIQLKKLITTLQKEGTAKDTLLKKSKTETEKYRLDCRNKEMEISSLISKIQKQTITEQVKKDLKKKEEEISSIRYRMKKADEKVNEKDLTIENLRNQVQRLNDSTEHLEKSLKILEQENTHYRSKCLHMENSEQSNHMELENIKRKFDRLLQQVRQIAELDDDLNTVQNENDVVGYIHELRKARDTSLHEMENAFNEKARLENGMINEDDLHRLRSNLFNIESRLSRNGRTCKNLSNELQVLQNIETSEKLLWIKDFVTSLLSQEFSWEEEIESALEAVKTQSEECISEPTKLIHRLHIKLKDNSQKLDELESKISMSEDEHNKLYKDVKKEIKEKYKKKMEKALEELKGNEKQNYERLCRENDEKLALELEVKEQQMKASLKRYERDSESVSILKKRIKKLEKEILEEQVEKQRMQIEMENNKDNEVILKKKLKEENDKFEIQAQLMERKFQSYESVEQSLLKSQIKDQEMKIKSLESTLLDINKENKELECKLHKMKSAVKEHKSQNKKKEITEELHVIKLKKEMGELNTANKVLKNHISSAEKDCEEQKEIVKTLKLHVEGLTTKLTDLRGELQDEEKRKVEELQEKLQKQELEHIDQRKQLIQLSALVEEQKKKLMEQDSLLQKQSNTLAYQADGLREKVTDEKAKRKAVVKRMDSTPENIRMVGQRCLGQRHDQVINKQKEALSDLRDSMNPPIVSHDSALQEIYKLRKEIGFLKNKLKVNGYFNETVDQQLYDEICRSGKTISAVNQECNVEKLSHRETQDALHKCEELLLRTLRMISDELGIDHVLGVKPMAYLDKSNREQVIDDRAKALENIINRIKALQSRLENKDHMLENYDEDLKNLRETERYVGVKNAEAKNLKAEVLQLKDENTYFQEALKKTRVELDDERRLHKSFKQKKVLLMDYKEDGETKKGHNCYVDEQKKYKEEQKVKVKEELLKKKDYEINLLKQELVKSDLQLNEAKEELLQLTFN